MASEKELPLTVEEQIAWRHHVIRLSAELAEMHPEHKTENYANIDGWLDEINEIRRRAAAPVEK